MTNSPHNPKGKRRIVHGLDPWKTVGDKTFDHWDRWLLALLVENHRGDWDGLRECLKEGRRHATDRGVEAMLSHVHELRERLQRCGLAPDELLGDIGSERKRLLKRARSKILEQDVPASDRSRAMQETPRKRLYARALRGNWKPFPVSPTHIMVSFEREVERRAFYHESATCHLADRLGAMLAQKARECEDNPAATLALFRGFLTLVLEAIERVDDSDGCMGDTFVTAFKQYLAVDWASTGIALEAYLRDLLEFVVWEDYGMTSRSELVPFFETLDPEQVPLVEQLLRELQEELLGFDLEYQAESALTHLGMLVVARRELDRFAELAREMGSREWERITTMAEAALSARRRDLAEAVFEAADQPGNHRDYLTQRRRELLHKARRS